MKARIAHSLWWVMSGVMLAPMSVYAESCPPTPTMSTGTHFEPITQERVDIGEGLLVQGRILNTACEPVAGAKIAHWQANNAGVYVDSLRAFLYSDAKGGYRFNTEWPAAFVPHIHFIVTAEGYRTLTTQWVGERTTERIRFDMVLERQ